MAGKHSFLVIPLFLLFFSNLSAQTDGYFIFPQPLPNGNYTSSVGFIAAGLPEDQIEEASTMLRGPLFNYQGLYGLPNNFRIYGSIHTNIITYHFSIGPKWGLSFEKYSFALGFDIAYWFGQLEHFGFQSKIKGVISYPNLTVGYDFEKFAISVKGELIILTSLKEQQDDVEIKTDRITFAGATGHHMDHG